MDIDKIRKRIRTVVLLIGFLFLCSPYLFSQTYGLKFNAYNFSLDRRTELDLCPDEFFKLQDEFEISFDYKITRIQSNSNAGFFGYVFRVINSEDKNIDLLSTPTPDIGLNLVVGESNTIIPAQYPLEYINNWIRLRIKFLLSEDRLIFYTPDTFYVHENVGFRQNEEVKIVFGANDYKHFKNSDVPSMTIKDLKILEKGKVKYHWELNEKEGNKALDKINGRWAIVKNPSWEVLNHQNWQKIFEHELKGEISVAVDNEHGDVFMLGKDDFTEYSTLKNNISKTKYTNVPAFYDRNFRTIYSPVDKTIYAYLVEEGHLYSLDINTGTWNKTGKPVNFQTKFRHHNHYFSRSDTSIYIFGGYGMHRYNNEVVKIDVNDKKWNHLPVDKNIFTPRYLAGLGELNDTIYIFGGYGSASGNQLINPQSYFDLITYSIKDGSWSKKFEVDHLIDDMIVGNTMWIDKTTRNYYALVFSKIKFENKIQLIKGNLDSPQIELVGDEIPFQFLDIRTEVYLYFMPAKNKLYTYISYTNDSTAKVAIYSIDNPPGKASGSKKDFVTSSKFLRYLLMLFLLLTAMAVGMILWKKKVAKKEQKQVDIPNANDVETVISRLGHTTIGLLDYNFILFGGFQVFNKDFQDITYKFSPLLKELFLLILLHTLKNNKGISSEKITEVLWYDKTEKSARNNRSVNMAKLRTILDEIGSCELSKKTGYWKINFEPTQLKGDYLEFLDITASKNNMTKQSIDLLIKIVEKGAFLSNVHYDWLDEYKASVSDTIIDTLVKYGKSCNIKEDADFIIHLADSIFNFDMINEDAMILKCMAQYCMGKHSHAKATYAKFFKEYVTMYGQEYERSFVDILEIKE
ncbi:kelch repeat-containing protein [uncultured Draconibacterium sp.]|uniref:Kelch repeat-containing protein n=1 Tax=uncultured Draconibacterium sp. TaxID=1573823 RepID=UPI0029C7D957|nr:kelch repeat-containing protein [uncultured Draconibacterium sp.]